MHCDSIRSVHVSVVHGCALPAAFPPAPATSDPPPSAAVVWSAVPPLTGTAGLHTAACLLPCPTHTHTHTHTSTHTNVQQKVKHSITDMHTSTGTHSQTWRWTHIYTRLMRGWTEVVDANTKNNWGVRGVFLWKKTGVETGKLLQPIKKNNNSVTGV